MSENRKDPRCPYCGSEMNENLFAYGNGGGWCNFECPNCGATSPKKENSESCNKAEFAAYFVAKKRWQEPNRVLTLDEVLEIACEDYNTEQETVMYLEYGEDYEGYAIVTDLETDGSKILLEFSGIGGGVKQNEKDYGSIWRCWRRKPTKNERENTPWEAKHNEH